MNKSSKDVETVADELVAAFGESRLVRRDGALHLIGGSMADRTEALEWVMMFLPDEAVRIRR